MIPSVTSTPTGAPTMFATATKEALIAAHEAIIALIEFSPALAPQFVRMGFHDCVGGCDGCVDLLNKDNRGLELPIQFLSQLLEEHAVHGVTCADIWALAALTGAEQTSVSSSVIFTFEWYGRPTCKMLSKAEDCC
jgi:hypothetical protein